MEVQNWWLYQIQVVFLVINYSFTVYTLPPNRPLKASPSPNTYQNNLSVHFNPLKPSVIIWLHFECSVPHRPNLPFLPSEHLCYGSLRSCNSVCLSVCHTHALWQNQIMHCGYFDTTRKGNHSSFLTPTDTLRLKSALKVIFETRRLRQISAYNISTIRHNKKVQLWWIGSWSTGFPTSYRLSVYVTHKSPLSGSKSNYTVFWIKVKFNRIKSATVSLWEKLPG